MALLEIQQLSFRYPDAGNTILDEVSLTVEEGQFVLLCGASGSGKSTLLRHLKKGLEPAGVRAGSRYFRDKPYEQLTERAAASEIGMVMQDPDNQIVLDQVRHELAFALENLGFARAVMHRRIAEMVQFFGLEAWLDKRTDTLSGGQKQIVNLASVLILHPSLLILDEPTAQLDPIAAKEFLLMLKRLNEEFGMTIVMTEHRLEDVFPLADLVVLLKEGKLAAKGSPQQVISEMWKQQGSELAEYIPSIPRLALSLSEHNRSFTDVHELLPLTVKEGQSWFRNISSVINSSDRLNENDENHTQASGLEALLTCRELVYQYTPEQPAVLRGLDLQVSRGERLAILGGNGSGKSTLLKLLAGLLAPRGGSVKLQGTRIHKLKDAERVRRIGYLPQNPLAFFAHDTVEEELRKSSFIESSSGKEGWKAEAERFGLTALLDRHPHDLSGGERQLAALACILLSQPEVLLIDEPTKGLDPNAKARFGMVLQSLREEGKTIVMVTHDVEFAARYADQCALLFDGMIAAHGTPADLFCGNHFYTTAIHRMVRSWAPQALTGEDVLRLCSSGKQ